MGPSDRNQLPKIHRLPFRIYTVAVEQCGYSSRLREAFFTIQTLRIVRLHTLVFADSSHGVRVGLQAR